MNISWAGNYEDIVLRRTLTSEQGQYVDVGAHQHRSGSLTYWCHERGWEGLCVEPQHQLARELMSARPSAEVFTGCVSDRVGSCELWIDSADPALSTMDSDLIRSYKEAGRLGRTVIVEVSTLNALLLNSTIKPGFDLPKVDAEGHEREVLEGIDLGLWRPRVVVVEAVAPYAFTPTHHKWEDILLAAGYRFCHL